jgi:uncharacterized protein
VNFSGEQNLSFDINTVWAALHDTDLLSKTIPGCRSMKAVGENSYIVAVSLGVAAVKGDYEGKVKVFDEKVPTHYRVEGEGSGAPGFIKVKTDCFLEARGNETFIRWNCEAQVGGLIAGIGGRVLTGTSKFLAKQFFNVLTNEIRKRQAAGGSTESIGSGGSTSGSRRSWFVRLMRRLFGLADSPSKL